MTLTVKVESMAYAPIADSRPGLASSQSHIRVATRFGCSESPCQYALSERNQLLNACAKASRASSYCGFTISPETDP